MKTVTVSSRSKALQNLLHQARRAGLILQTPAGNRYILAPLENWLGFDVGASPNFADEVKRTARSKKLITHLARRRTAAKRVPLAEVKRQLGLKPR